jgi:ribonuclease J
VLPRVVEALQNAAVEGVADEYTLQQIVRRTVGKWVNETYRRRPMIVPVVVAV